MLACAQVGTSAGLLPRQRYTLEALLHGLLLPSGNDAATLLSEYFGRVLYRRRRAARPEVELDLFEEEQTGLTRLYRSEFVKAMNATAKELRMGHSQFVNPHGLDDCENRSTARDLVKLS